MHHGKVSLGFSSKYNLIDAFCCVKGSLFLLVLKYFLIRYNQVDGDGRQLSVLLKGR